MIYDDNQNTMTMALKLTIRAQIKKEIIICPCLTFYTTNTVCGQLERQWQLCTFISLKLSLSELSIVGPIPPEMLLEKSTDCDTDCDVIND